MNPSPLAAALLQAYAPIIANGIGRELDAGTAPGDVLLWLHEDGEGLRLGTRQEAAARLADNPAAGPLLEAIRSPAAPGFFLVMVSKLDGDAEVFQARFTRAERPAA